MRGWSLVELIIGLLIVGILCAVAIPSYQQQLIQSRRAEAKTLLIQLAVEQERYRLNHLTYADSASLSLPTSEYYIFAVKNESVSFFEIVAKAKLNQKDSVDCLSLSINQSLKKEPVECW